WRGSGNSSTSTPAARSLPAYTGPSTTVAGATPASEASAGGQPERSGPESTWRASGGQPSSRACSAAVAARPPPATNSRPGLAPRLAAWSPAHSSALDAERFGHLEDRRALADKERDRAAVLRIGRPDHAWADDVVRGAQ